MNHGPQAALALAQAAADAYDSHADGIQIGTGLCHCVIRRTADGEIIVAWRGTENLSQWLSNAEVGKARFNNLRVHAGFSATVGDLLRDVDDAIEEVRQSVHDQVWTCGHSRGGAHALLYSVFRTASNRPLTGTYTYGCPRVGDSKFAAWCDRNVTGHHRYVYQSDIVTRIPRIGYAHCGQLHWHDGREWRLHMPLHSRIGAFLFFRKWPFIGDTAKDHGIGSYLGALQ